jgi:hypothetical protein
MDDYEFELDRFKRDINLVEYAEGRGYERVRRESSRGSASMRHPGNDDKIIVARANGGHWIYFSVRDERDNGTIVDFVQRRENRSLGEVREELRQWLGTPRPERAPAERAPELKPVERDRHAVLRALAAATDADNCRYLNERGLRQETLVDPKFAGTWKNDARGNVLFVHRDEEDVSGYEIKNRDFTGFATGGTKALWHSVPAPSDRTFVVAESAIDALSYHQLRRQPSTSTRYASTAGAPSGYQLELIAKALSTLSAGSSFVAAVDADEGGSRIARQLETVARRFPQISFHRDSPDPLIGKDWNDVLKRLERDFIRSLPGAPMSPGRPDPGRSR